MIQLVAAIKASDLGLAACWENLWIEAAGSVLFDFQEPERWIRCPNSKRTGAGAAAAAAEVAQQSASIYSVD